MPFDEDGKLIVPDDYKLTITVSYDEKPGIQAISNTAPDLRPTAENGEVYRDAEYKHLGTLSLLAGIYLLALLPVPPYVIIPPTSQIEFIGSILYPISSLSHFTTAISK